MFKLFSSAVWAAAILGCGLIVFGSYASVVNSGASERCAFIDGATSITACSELIDGSTTSRPIREAAYFNRGRTYLGLRRYKESVADFSQVIGINPSRAEAYLSRGSAYANLTENDAALKDFSKAIQLNPNNSQAFEMRGSVYLVIGNYRQGIGDFTTALQRTPGSARIFVERGSAYLAAHQYDYAIDDFDAAERLQHIDPWMLYLRSAAYGAKKNHVRAIQDLEKAIKIKKSSELLTALCWQEGLLGKQLNVALATCNEALALNKAAANVFRSRGLVQLRLGDYRSAISDETKALEHEPNVSTSLYLRAIARQRSGDRERAFSDVEAALASDPHVPDVFSDTGLMFIK